MAAGGDTAVMESGDTSAEDAKQQEHGEALEPLGLSQQVPAAPVPVYLAAVCAASFPLPLLGKLEKSVRMHSALPK